MEISKTTQGVSTSPKNNLILSEPQDLGLCNIFEFLTCFWIFELMVNSFFALPYYLPIFEIIVRVQNATFLNKLLFWG